MNTDEQAHQLYNRVARENDPDKLREIAEQLYDLGEYTFAARAEHKASEIDKQTERTA